MIYRFVPMTRAHADIIIATWAYEAEFAVYDYVHEADHLSDPSGWGVGIFAVLDGVGELIGELSIEFFDEHGQPTEYADYGNQELINARELWIGFGLRPELVGRGLGPGFVGACVDFAVQHSGYRGDVVRLGVATFNQRAIKAYSRAGFRAFDHAVGEIGGHDFECVYMEKQLQQGEVSP